MSDLYKTYSFERLEAWKESRILVKMIYSLTRDFPDVERFGLTGQIRRAAVSVASNIAEGSGSPSNKEFARYLTISRNSIFEIVNILHVFEQRKIITESERLALYPKLIDLS